MPQCLGTQTALPFYPFYLCFQILALYVLVDVSAKVNKCIVKLDLWKYVWDFQTSFEGGEVVLTSHRLLWGRPGDIPRGLTCLSLPLRYVVFVEEEMGSSSFGFIRSKKIVLHLSEALPGEINETVKFKKIMEDVD
jgi:hypothetical protein